MDRILGMYDLKIDDDLLTSERYGFACQRDMSITINYGGKYFDNYKAMKDTPMARKIISVRNKMVLKHCKHTDMLLDIGIGSGEFVEKCPVRVMGYDVNKYGQDWLQKRGQFYDMETEIEYKIFKGFCLWDVLEHLDEPELLFRKIPKGALLFVSIPIFYDIAKVRESKHFKPGEHKYYFSLKAFVEWMYDWGFSLLECENGEILAGREEIYNFVFKKDLPEHSELLEQYKQIHDAEHYGETSSEFLKDVMQLVSKTQFRSILDFGCGRSDLLSHLSGDGKRKLYRYDPAINKYKEMTQDSIDMVLCNDVMEHVLKRDIEKIFSEIKDKSTNAIFSIATRPARKKLPNGMNAHVTVMPENWWEHIIRKHFKSYQKIRDYSVGFLCKTF